MSSLTFDERRSAVAFEKQKLGHWTLIFKTKRRFFFLFLVLTKPALITSFYKDWRYVFRKLFNFKGRWSRL